jgi:hypothetical protein
MQRFAPHISISKSAIAASFLFVAGDRKFNLALLFISKISNSLVKGFGLTCSKLIGRFAASKVDIIN